MTLAQVIPLKSSGSLSMGVLWKGPSSVFLAMMVVNIFYKAYVAQAQVQVPPQPIVFNFGDSLTDPGNNNYIVTLAKSNYLPNGVDYPQGPTGRFCNGRTVADVITDLMNVPRSPAYMAPATTGQAILRGVNYASAAGGILDSTGANYIGRIGLNQQLRDFQNTKSEFEQLLTPAVADPLLAKSFYFITIGSNDYINNYLLPVSPTRPQYTPEQFQDYLVSELSNQIQSMYNMGARKISLVNVGPLGCIPSQLAQQNSPDGSCIGFINEYVKGFNNAVGLMLDSLATQLPGSRFLYGDAYSLVYDKVLNPATYGLTVVDQGCCGTGNFRGQIPCIPGTEECTDRSQYLFWDPFHPTDAVNEQLGNAFYSGPTSVISPINIQQLLALP